MNAFAVAVLGLSLAQDPTKTLPEDVVDIPSRQFAFPLNIQPGRKDGIAVIRLYVSEDRGKTWKQSAEGKPSDDRIEFTAAQDGMYWFALQVVLKDGKREPKEVSELRPEMKVLVNTAKKADRPPKPKTNEELQREVE